MTASASAASYCRGFAHGLMFHRFDARGAASGWQGALSAADFERILLRVGVECVLSPAEWSARAEADRLQPNDLCVTFDDALRCQMVHALPVLEKYGLQAFWFVYSCVYDSRPVRSEVYSYVAAQIGGMAVLVDVFMARCPPDMRAQLEAPAFASYREAIRHAAPFYSALDIEWRFLRNHPANREQFEALMDAIVEERGFPVADVAATLWLTEADLRRMVDAGHVIGLHSYDHPYDMTALSRAQQREQYTRNFLHLEAVTGTSPRCVAHPLNAYNDDTVAVLGDLGIRWGFRANTLPPPGRGINASRFEIAREDSTILFNLTCEER